jgi:hypothetical protein
MGSTLPGLADEIGHAADARPPQLLIPIEKAADGVQSGRVRTNDLAAAGLMLGDQSCPLENRDVLLYGSEAHWVVLGQFGNTLPTLDGAPDDISPGGIGQRPDSLPTKPGWLLCGAIHGAIMAR